MGRSNFNIFIYDKPVTKYGKFTGSKKRKRIKRGK